MAHASSNPDPIADVRLYLQGVAKYLVDHLYGPAGPTWGTPLAQLESTIGSLQLTLADHILHLALARQSEAATADENNSFSCPACQQPTQPRPPEKRVVRTDVGIAEWAEPRRFCGKCRKAFFPSVEKSRP
jgi:hypothetical protein